MFRRAVVLGGGIAGSMTARVLSDHADHVLIIEPDDIAALDLPDDRIAADPAGAVAPRPGVPQGSQVHALLPSERAGEVVTYHQADSRRRDFNKLDRSRPASSPRVTPWCPSIRSTARG